MSAKYLGRKRFRHSLYINCVIRPAIPAGDGRSLCSLFTTIVNRSSCNHSY